jgi:hypothetical protein
MTYHNMESELESAVKEIVARLKDAPNAPEAVVEAVNKVIVAEVASAVESQDARQTVTSACRGVTAGILLFEQDLPKTAVALLKGMTTIAQRTGLSPDECMTWAMEGIAQTCKLAPDATATAVRAAIDENFMGAAETYDKFV